MRSFCWSNGKWDHCLLFLLIIFHFRGFICSGNELRGWIVLLQCVCACTRRHRGCMCVQAYCLLRCTDSLETSWQKQTAWGMVLSGRAMSQSLCWPGITFHLPLPCFPLPLSQSPLDLQISSNTLSDLQRNLTCSYFGFFFVRAQNFFGSEHFLKKSDDDREANRCR